MWQDFKCGPVKVDGEVNSENQVKTHAAWTKLTPMTEAEDLRPTQRGLSVATPCSSFCCPARDVPYFICLD